MHHGNDTQIPMQNLGGPSDSNTKGPFDVPVQTDFGLQNRIIKSKGSVVLESSAQPHLDDSEMESTRLYWKRTNLWIGLVRFAGSYEKPQATFDTSSLGNRREELYGKHLKQTQEPMKKVYTELNPMEI